MKAPKPNCETCEEREKSVFCDLSPEKLSQLEEAKVSKTYKAREVIFIQGEFPSGVYCLTSGKVKIYKMDPDGNQQIVRLAGPGDLLGYRSIICNEAYFATAETIEPAHICYIDKKAFLSTLEKDPKTAFHVMNLLAGDLRHAETQMTHFIHKKVRERLAELFLLLNSRYGEKTQYGIKLNISLTREEVAEIIGTTQESVIRLMSDFRENGLIDVKGRNITIRNMNALIETANLSEC